jgi:hypothetical protein
MEEGVYPSWDALFANGLPLRLARGETEAEHEARVRLAWPIVKRLRNDGKHERRKAWELIRRAYSRLPEATTRREELTDAAQALGAAASAYARFAADENDQEAVRLVRDFLADPIVAGVLEALARPRPRPGHRDPGLRKFRVDTVAPRGGFRADAEAEAVAAACGVLRVGPRP